MLGEIGPCRSVCWASSSCFLVRHRRSHPRGVALSWTRTSASSSKVSSFFPQRSSSDSVLTRSAGARCSSALHRPPTAALELYQVYGNAPPSPSMDAPLPRPSRIVRQCAALPQPLDPLEAFERSPLRDLLPFARFHQHDLRPYDSRPSRQDDLWDVQQLFRTTSPRHLLRVLLILDWGSRGLLLPLLPSAPPSRGLLPLLPAHRTRGHLRYLRLSDALLLSDSLLRRRCAQ